MRAGRLSRLGINECAAANVQFRVVEAHGPVREMLRSEGLEELVGPITRYTSLADALAEHERP